jgi:hypothetical protein
MKTLDKSFVSLCSKLDKRRWSTVSVYRGKGFTAYREECSRRGKPEQNSVRRNVRTSLKCECKASYTLFSDGKVSFANDHTDLCLPDPHMDNDGYVFNSGLSSEKKARLFRILLIC